MIVALLMLAGGAGAASRFGLDAALTRRLHRNFPLATLLVNVSGSLLLGVLTGWVVFGRGGHTADDVRLVLGTGFCGGYTTFSTASFETVRLLQRRRTAAALGYVAASVALTVGAAALGLLVIR